MGFILSKIIEFFTISRNNFKIIILGMQNAGKTTILYRLSLGQLVKTSPTIGSNVEEITYNNATFQAWDLGGQESTRSLWDVYYMNTDAVVYVIDSQDDEYFNESKAQFHKLLNHQALKNATILIFANKQDLPGAKPVNQIIQDYELDKIKSHIWHIQSCSALKGEGLVTGIKWLSEQLIFKGKNNFAINPYLVYENENEKDDKTNNDKNENNENKETIITIDNKDNNINSNNDGNDKNENKNEDENKIDNISSDASIKVSDNN